MNPKQRAAEAAMSFLRDGMVVGLGTGSTADFFLKALGTAINEKRLTNIVGVSTSQQSERRAQELGIPLTTLTHAPKLDITIDGADEVDPHLDLIKGLGGALLREKIVAQHSDRLIIIADQGKVVSQLGAKSPLPVEVAPFAHETHDAFLRNLEAIPTLRLKADGTPFITDNGNYIFDCRFAGIDDPERLEAKLREHAGIVECGLFLKIATIALIAGENDVQTIARADLK